MKKKKSKGTGNVLSKLKFPKLPSSYKYTAGSTDASGNGGFKFVVDATPELQKTFRETIPQHYTVDATANVTVNKDAINALLGVAGMFATAIIVNAAFDYAGKR